MQIHLLSGKIHSGKTSYLQSYAVQNNCSGMLSPVIQNKRHFYNISTKETIEMEASDSEENVLEIGKYKFSQNAFDWAIQKVELELKQKTNLLILDEIGPLELKGQGFAALLTKILKTKFEVIGLLLVIREQAVQEVITKFEMDETQLKYWNWKPYPDEQ